MTDVIEGLEYKTEERNAALKLAILFHETYERLAPDFHYETRKESAKPWSDIPENNKNLMIAVCHELRAALTPYPMDEDVREALDYISLFCGVHVKNEVDRKALEKRFAAIRAATAQSVSPYKDYTWEDVAMLVQENRALKEAATAQKCEEVTVDKSADQHPTKGETP